MTAKKGSLYEIPELPTLEKAGPSVGMEEINENDVKLKFDDAVSEKNEKINSQETKELEKPNTNVQEAKEIKEEKGVINSPTSKENKVVENEKEKEIKIVEEEKETVNKGLENNNLKQEKEANIDLDLEGNVELDESAVVQMLRNNPLARAIMYLRDRPGERTKTSFASMEKHLNKPIPDDDVVEENSQISSIDGSKKIPLGSITPNTNQAKKDLQIATNLDDSRWDSKIGEAITLLYDILKITEDQSNIISQEMNDHNNK